MLRINDPLIKHSPDKKPAPLLYCGKQLVFFIMLFAATLGSQSALACKEDTKTRLEEIYCQIKAKGKGKNLPDFHQFRKNPPTTQALLLKQPARKLGISLPGKPAKPKSIPVKSKKSTGKIVPGSPTNASTTSTAKPASPPVSSTPFSANARLGQRCQLNRELIKCDGKPYELLTNLNNKNLPANVFGPDNTLNLPARNAAAFSSSSDHYYLSTTYVTYIEKMVELGLADATMSFTKYTATYDDIKSKGGSFSGRFTKMYELLKKEKTTNAVKSRYNNNFPTTIKQCMELSSVLIVCDNVYQNWIYGIPN